MLDINETETMIIYTDGSASSQNIGAVGIRIITINIEGEELINDGFSMGYRNVNSGQMEIIACTAALEEAINQKLYYGKKKLILFTDSKYVVDNYKKAMFEWCKNRWLRKNGKPILDADLWVKLINTITIYNKWRIYIDIKWIRGHDKDIHNKAVDGMAKRALKIPLQTTPKLAPITIYEPRKIVNSPKLNIGSVEMKGQKISIKILSGKLLKPQNLWCHQYQVITKSSPFAGKVDQIFSTFALDTNKTYYVKFNSQKGNPRIEKLYWKLKSE